MWYVVCGVWCEVCGVWCVVCGLLADLRGVGNARQGGDELDEVRGTEKRREKGVGHQGVGSCQ